MTSANRMSDEMVRADVCPRRNADQRSYKIIMSVAGDSRSFAIVPKELNAVAELLADAFDLASRPDYVIGFAPGGIALTVAVAQVIDTPAVIAYKTRLGLADEISFSEPHCLFNTFYLYGVSTGDAVILIDDEVDSGNTVANAIEVLRGKDVRVLDAGSAVEVLHSGVSLGRDRLNRLGIDLKSVLRLEVDRAAGATR